LPWPLTESILVLNQKLNGYVLIISGEPDGRLRARLEMHGGEPLAETISCPVLVNGDNRLVLTVIWKLPSTFQLRLNGTIVADAEKPDSLPEAFDGRSINRSAAASFDFARENAEAHIRRKGRLNGTHPIQNRVAGNFFDDRASLSDEFSQIRDLTALIDRGQTYHAKGLASRIRVMVADGKLPLLQRCAAGLDVPLIVFTDPNPRERPPITIDLSLFMNIDGQPRDAYSNPIDLDVWLRTPGGSFEKKLYTHEDLIWQIGSMYASHADRDLAPIVTFLRGTSSGVSGGIERDIVVEYFVRVAKAVLHLSEQIILKKA
jgi:hypothetical protein